MIDSLKERAAGFICAQIEEPFLIPPVEEVSKEELAVELKSMSEDLLGEKNGWASLLSPIEDRVLSFLSGRIMGIYTQRYIEDRPSKILIQPDNIRNLSVQLGLDEETTLLWILSHEMFHAAQFDPGLPLREDMQRRVRQFVKTKQGLEDLKMAYSWIEGSADWLMDRPGLLNLEDIFVARKALDARRQQVSLASIVLRLLGNKQAQYARGRAFVESAVGLSGQPALLLPARRPELLPQPSDTPQEWAARLQRHIPRSSYPEVGI